MNCKVQFEILYLAKTLIFALQLLHSEILSIISLKTVFKTAEKDQSLLAKDVKTSYYPEVRQLK